MNTKLVWKKKRPPLIYRLTNISLTLFNGSLLSFFLYQIFFKRLPDVLSVSLQPTNISLTLFKSQRVTALSLSQLFATAPCCTLSLSHSVYLQPSQTPLTISPLLRLSLPDSSGRNLFPPSAANASALLLRDDGSLAFNSWTSFDSPTDTVLPGQSVPSNNISLTSGPFRLSNATTLLFNTTDSYWSTNTILNLTSSGFLLMSAGQYIAADADGNDTRLRRLTLDPDGNLRIYSLSPSGNWRVVWRAVQELCTIHGVCGLGAVCVPNGANATACVCPPGYRTAGDGCSRKLDYLPSSKYLPMEYVSFTSGPETTQINPLDFDECRSTCSGNASCVAFSYKFNGGQNCFHHYRVIRSAYWSPASEITMYVRVASAETDVSGFTGMSNMIDTVCPIHVSLPLPPNESRMTAAHLGVISSLFAIELLAGVLAFWAFLRRYSKYRDMARTFGLELLPAGGPRRFSLVELRAATNNFAYPVGDGGFGIVYKGILPDGRQVAVKRLKKVTGGEAEFWGEVTIIARMHHLNLVGMWGFCADKEQRMLVYEYIPNGSLDKYLFSSGAGAAPPAVLDWSVRFRIAIGVARAVAYLHEECLEWVLHCDIKPENILLGDDFCPKVSDFGLSKLAGGRREMVTMSGIRGTRGYLAPEWVAPGRAITAKVDVYSFGMVLLEIVTGVRSFDFRRESLASEDWYMGKWAYEKVYVERRVEDILDRRILATYDDRAHLGMVDRMVKTAMWCLQDRPEMRPSMGRVAKMLEGTVEITEPGKPAIFCNPEEDEDTANSSISNKDSYKLQSPLIQLD